MQSENKYDSRVQTKKFLWRITSSILGINGSYVMWTLALGDKNINWKQCSAPAGDYATLGLSIRARKARIEDPSRKDYTDAHASHRRPSYHSANDDCDCGGFGSNSRRSNPLRRSESESTAFSHTCAT